MIPIKREILGLRLPGNGSCGWVGRLAGLVFWGAVLTALLPARVTKPLISGEFGPQTKSPVPPRVSGPSDLPPTDENQLVTGKDNRRNWLSHNELTESSGLCTSHGGAVVWTHNDSGDLPRLFAFDRQGHLITVANIQGANARDWEDICAFQVQGRTYLAIGDVGDNQALRSLVQVYIVMLPAKVEELKSQQLKVLTTIQVTYTGGPIDCESIAYDPLEGRLLLASKERFRCRLFEVDFALEHGEQSQSANFLQSFVVPMVTGADISPDGSRLVLASYGVGAMLYRDKADKSRTDRNQTDRNNANRNQTDRNPTYRNKAEQERWGHPEGIAASYFELPIRRQGESICFASALKPNLYSESNAGAGSAEKVPSVDTKIGARAFSSVESKEHQHLQDAARLLLTSEFTPTPLHDIACPAVPPSLLGLPE